MIINYDFAPFLGDFTMIGVYSMIIIIILPRIVRRLSKKDYSNKNQWIMPTIMAIYVIHSLGLLWLDGIFWNDTIFGIVSLFLFILVFYYLYLFVSEKKKNYYNINRPKKLNYENLYNIIKDKGDSNIDVSGKLSKTSNMVLFINKSNEEMIEIMDEIISFDEITVERSSRENIIYISIALFVISIIELLNISILLYINSK